MSLAEPAAKSAHLWARDEHDWYVEPEWCSRRLFDEETFEGGVLDPACGRGRIVQSARAAGLDAIGSDIVPRAEGMISMWDFLSDEFPFEILSPAAGGEAENVVSNPPFRFADQFVSKALAITPRKVAMLLPLTWMAGGARARRLEAMPLRRIWVLTPRPSMPPGAVLEAGLKPGGGTKDFAWFVFLRGYDGAPELRWLHRDRPTQPEA